MSTLGEIIAQIRGALRTCGDARQHLARAAELIEESVQLLGQALYGSTDAEAEQALALLAHAHQAVADLYRVLDNAENGVRDYLTRLGAADSTDTGTSGQAGTPRPERNSPPPPAPEQIRRLRDELPPDVPPPEKRHPGTPRQKTHGRWVGPDGQVRPIVSGEDEGYAESVKAFRDLGARGIPQRASDVEMKLAAYMRNHGVRSAAVVINNTPCPGPFGCDALVPVLLPQGSTLTVHGSNNFTKTYQGGAQPPWRKR